MNELGTGVVEGWFVPSHPFLGAPACSSAADAKGVMQGVFLDPAKPCDQALDCESSVCMFGKCVALAFATTPLQPDFSSLSANAYYCTSAASSYPQLKPGTYELFGYYDCDGGDALSAGDLASANPPALTVEVAPGSVVHAPNVVLDRECAGACAEAKAP